MTPQEEYEKLFIRLYQICLENGWGDPFSYARSREIMMSIKLGHKMADSYSGADGIDECGECEYKSTIGKNINGAYNGISVYDLWEEQEKYLIEQKIGKYTNHYIARFEGPYIPEVWKLSGSDVLKILLPKLSKKHSTCLGKKDPRLGASLTKKEIYKYGERIIFE